jgi:hypothetical protein
MLTEKDISNIKVTWKTLTFPEIKSRLQELYHSDMPLVDLISALYWDLIETKQKQKQRGAKTITFTDKELEVLSHYLWQNPCSSGCCCKVPQNVDCYDVKPNGEYKCPFQQTSHQIMSKLMDEGE